jgi:restriction system protein
MRWILPSIEFQNLMLKNLAALAPRAAWFFALLFLIPGLVSFLKRKQRQHLLDSRNDLESIRKLSWSDFELLIGEAFRRQGYAVEERGGSAPDGGVDLVLRKDGQKTLVQCKHWKSRQVGVSIVRELLGVMTAQSASGGIVVTAGDYTAEARSFARDSRMRLIDGTELAGMIDATTKDSNRREPTIRSGVSSAEATCPKCGSAMVKRVAKGGANVGQAFWGCSTFPKCRGTQSI